MDDTIVGICRYGVIIEKTLRTMIKLNFNYAIKDGKLVTDKIHFQYVQSLEPLYRSVKNANDIRK